jgi:hypothetical protein
MAHLRLEPIGFVVQRLVQPKRLLAALADVLTSDLAYFSRWDFYALGLFAMGPGHARCSLCFKIDGHHGAMANPHQGLTTVGPHSLPATRQQP